MDVAVIGGGAAGLMAAATLVEEAAPRVTLFERNPRLGAKVIISGGGRCNVTTGLTSIRAVLARYPRGGRWLRPAMHAFPPAAVIDWFERHGVPLKTEADGRVFPVSDNGHDVVAAFARVLAAGRVDVRLRCRVTAVTPAGAGRFAIATEHGGAGPFEAVILTTGGSAYRHTGSTGDGYGFARSLGHTVTPLYPSLTAWVVAEPWARALAGLSFPDAELAIAGMKARFRGPFLFTHFGVSGPAVFALGSLVADRPFSPEAPLPVRVNLLPELRPEAVDGALQERLGRLGGRAVVNVLDTLLPRSICPVLCALAEVAPRTPAARLPRAARQRLAMLIGALPLPVTGRRSGDEFVTAGGIPTEEVDPVTMQSRLVPGLYLAGEILNVDGFTGGFNLQAAWCTGRAAGSGWKSAQG